MNLESREILVTGLLGLGPGDEGPCVTCGAPVGHAACLLSHLAGGSRPPPAAGRARSVLSTRGGSRKLPGSGCHRG